MKMNTPLSWTCQYYESLHGWHLWCDVLSREMCFSSFAVNISVGVSIALVSSTANICSPVEWIMELWCVWGILTSVHLCMLCITNLPYFECFVVSEPFHELRITFATRPDCSSAKSWRIRNPVKIKHQKKAQLNKQNECKQIKYIQKCKLI